MNQSTLDALKLMASTLAPVVGLLGFIVRSWYKDIKTDRDYWRTAFMDLSSTTIRTATAAELLAQQAHERRAGLVASE